MNDFFNSMNGKTDLTQNEIKLYFKEAIGFDFKKLLDQSKFIARFERQEILFPFFLLQIFDFVFGRTGFEFEDTGDSIEA